MTKRMFNFLGARMFGHKQSLFEGRNVNVAVAVSKLFGVMVLVVKVNELVRRRVVIGESNFYTFEYLIYTAARSERRQKRIGLSIGHLSPLAFLLSNLYSKKEAGE